MTDTIDYTKLPAGTKVRLRYGSVGVFVGLGNKDDAYPVVVEIAGEPYWYAMDGRHKVGCDDPRDIVGVVEEAPPRIDYTKLAFGTKVRRRDGLLGTIIGLSKDDPGHPVVVELNGKQFTYDTDGRYWRSVRDDPMDLVGVVTGGVES